MWSHRFVHTLAWTLAARALAEALFFGVHVLRVTGCPSAYVRCEPVERLDAVLRVSTLRPLAHGSVVLEGFLVVFQPGVLVVPMDLEALRVGHLEFPAPSG